MFFVLSTSPLTIPSKYCLCMLSKSQASCHCTCKYINRYLKRETLKKYNQDIITISNKIHRNFIILSNIHSLLKCFLWSEVFLLRNNLFESESKQDLFIVFRNYVTMFFLIYNSLYLHLPLPLSFISLRNRYILTVEHCIFWIWPIVSFWCSLTCSSFPAISFILIGRCGVKWKC